MVAPRIRSQSLDISQSWASVCNSSDNTVVKEESPPRDGSAVQQQQWPTEGQTEARHSGELGTLAHFLMFTEKI